jgi:hypothetical protein
MTIHKIAMGAKPDPYKFKIVQKEIVNGNTVILANYEGCLTFGGNKLMLLKGEHEIGETLDPHFLDDDYPVVARFVPNEDGWNLARICAEEV